MALAAKYPEIVLLMAFLQGGYSITAPVAI